VLLIEFAPIFPDHVLLLLSGSIYSVPVMNEYIKERRQRRDLKHGEDEYNYNGGDNISTSANQRQGNKLSLKPAVFCLSSSMPLIIAGILYTWSPYKLHILHVFLLPVIILLLSILWTPEIQLDFYRSSDRRMDSRQKTSFMYAIVKIVAIPLCISVVLLTRFKDLRSLYFFDFIRYGFEQLLHFRIYIHVIVISFAGLLTIFTGILCAKMRLTTTGMLLPSMMSIPTVIGLNIMLCLSTEGGYCYDPSFWFISSTILAAIVWFLPLLLYGSIFTRPSDILLKPFQEIFLQFTWTPFFTDQYLILNYHSDGFGSKLCEVSGDLEVAKSKSKVFICTTMFNEKEIEMKRLLLSLNNLAKSSRLQHVYLEAHIFMDNGSRDNILNKNSLILLSLIKCLDGVKVNSLKQYLTPYGIQMSWTLRNDFQLFVHFKDCLKFKAKKRWSQVMYMNYILNYRCKVAKNESYRREYSYEKCLTNMKFSSYQHIPYGGISQPNDTCVKLHKEYENYSGKHIRNKKRQQPNHSSILKMELRKLRNLLKVGNEEVYENIEACLSKNKIRSSGIDHSKLPIIQTISNVIDLLNKRLHPRYMTTNYELPFQITAEESSSEESGIQSIPYTISENELEFSRGFTPGEDILDASENEAESTDVSSLYDDQIVTSDETLNKHAERTSPGSDTPLADNRTQDLSSDDQNSSSVDKNVSFPIISPLIACPGKSASASCVNLPNPICKYSFDLTPKHIRTEKPFQKGYVQYDVKTMNRKTKQSENKRSYQTTSSTTSPSSSSINTISSNIASDILQGNNYDEYTYILATDADMEFDDKSLSRLIDLCNRDKNVGGACGRTSPVGHINTPVVWYQKFEYAKGKSG
ncbi:chitin synthase chs-2-like, partial [Argonauta hians]